MESRMLAERLHRRQKLGAIYENLTRLQPRISAADLDKLGIRRELMTLSEHGGPYFFAVYQAPVCKPDPDIVDGYLRFDGELLDNARILAWFLSEYFNHCELPERDSHPRGVAYSDYGNFNFGDLIDLTHDAQWEVRTTWHMPDSGAPHMVVVMFSEMAASEELFHGEIKTAIRVMRADPVVLCNREHHLRVIEAYHDGQELVLRTTPLLDMARRDEDLLRILTKWCLGGPSQQSTKLA
ncbi:hypothetical protein BDV18DRAFT_164644 [Aspergillus unguis]